MLGEQFALNWGMGATGTNGDGGGAVAVRQKTHRARVGCAGLHTVRLQSLGRRTHPVQFLDNSLIEIMVGLGVVAVRMVCAAYLFKRSRIVG